MPIAVIMLAGLLFILPAEVQKNSDRRALSSDSIAILIEQLGSPDYHTREEATRAFLRANKSVIPALRAAVNDPDSERARRARLLLETVTIPAAIDELQGRWEYVFQFNSGMLNGEIHRATLDLRGRRMRMRAGNGESPAGKMEFRVDPNQQPPHFDILWYDSVIRGVYEVKGDTLTLCYPMELTGPRPTELSTKQGDQRRYQILRRITDDDR